MEKPQQRELEQFFAEVAPRLDTAQTLDDELDRQLARRFNVFRYLRTDEMGFSKMIADLLDPAGDHGQGAAFLKLLTDKLDFAKGVNLDSAKVQTERRIDGRRRVDIAVEIDGAHCLAIENKSNFAGDQEGQVEDDLKWLEREFSHSVLIYLSPTGDGPSEVSVALETLNELETKTPRRFAIMPCDSSDMPSDEHDSFRLPFSLVDWLADCRKNCDVDRLRWYLRETEAYCRQRYGGQAVTGSKKSAIADVVRRDSKNLTTAMAVYETWPEVAKKIKYDFLDLIYRHLPWDDLPEDMDGYWDYHDGRWSYMWIGRKGWRPYMVDGQEWFTRLYMEANSTGATNWCIGIASAPANRVSKGGQARIKELREELGKLGKYQQSNWPCWEWVDERYRDWNPLIPQMDEELRKDDGELGEIAAYFVHKFKEIADQAIPIIDRIDGR